jgi:hypothetical protein
VGEQKMKNMEKENTENQSVKFGFFQKEKSTWEKIFGTVKDVEVISKEENGSDLKFVEILEKNLDEKLSIEDLSRKVVQAALEVEFKDKKHYEKNYKKMVDTVSEALRKNPEMKKEMMSVAKSVLKKQKTKAMH